MCLLRCTTRSFISTAMSRRGGMAFRSAEDSRLLLNAQARLPISSGHRGSSRSNVRTRKSKTTLSPIYTIPDDIALEILQIAYEHHFPHCRLDDGLPHTNSPIAISQVSRCWRSLALSLPCIWTCIHVTPHQSKQYDRIVKLYLRRSGRLPLSISLQYYSYKAGKLEWGQDDGGIAKVTAGDANVGQNEASQGPRCPL